MRERFAQVLENLEKRGYSVHYFAGKEEAADWLSGQVPAGKQAAFGGSVTLAQLDLGTKLSKKGVDVIDYRNADYSPENLYEKQRSVFFAHSYFSSANALTEQGVILNVDGLGNRLAATVFGPKNVYFVAGRNKLTADMAGAIKRLEEVAAPFNCKRLDKQTPCRKTGRCQHCGAATSICRAWMALQYAPYGAKYHVVLIDEELGF
ncbi:MAG: lactate utilization protein [Clostridiales bacterium]|nr:lactate utilization protein [Clostridiales bacterium]